MNPLLKASYVYEPYSRNLIVYLSSFSSYSKMISYLDEHVFIEFIGYLTLSVVIYHTSYLIYQTHILVNSYVIYHFSYFNNLTINLLQSFGSIKNHFGILQYPFGIPLECFGILSKNLESFGTAWLP